MSSSTFDNSDPLQSLETALQNLPGDAGGLPDARSTLQSISISAGEAERPDVSQFATVLSDLIDVIETEISQDDAGSRHDIDDLVNFVRQSCGPLRAAFADEIDVSAELQSALEEARSRWGDYLSLTDHDVHPATVDDVWNTTGEDSDNDSWSNEGTESSPEDITAILSALSGSAVVEEHIATDTPSPNTKPSKSAKRELFGKSDHGLPSDPPPPVSVEMDPELLEAFAEDASAGLGRLEQLVLAVENSPADASLHQQICREMHTLKGASASVGLPDLAAYLHAVEDYVESSKGTVLEIAPMLHSVDAVRAQIAILSGDSGSKTSDCGSNESTAAPTRVFDNAAPGNEESIRVKASRVDRLMDMLAELVILRNQRDSRLTRLKHLYSELTRCVARIRIFADGQAIGLPVASPNQRNDSDGSQSQAVSGSAVEIATDISEFARTLRDLAEPMESENIAISQFIRQFRQELMEMRRMPVAGLFQRLNRAARDAARVEGKKIQFLLEGEHAGLDRSLQERLYEPLLHMVRNSVSHGIETEADRRKAGKSETGTLTLTAKGSPTTLVLEITDDGRGLDFEAIRRRGLEKGLISVADAMDEGKLARLIFHPGFSTKQVTSEISGRGVGMDVVAASLQRMRAKIDVESRPGAGTTMRLTIPLRSVIEHAMVVRVAGRLYALPMQVVQAAGPLSELTNNAAADGKATVRLRSLLGETDNASRDNEHFIALGSGRLSFSAAASKNIRKSATSRENGVTLIVDEVVGPDEVVVRSLPSLLKSHPLLGGMTLSGAGEIVLLLDGQRLLEVAIKQGKRVEHNQQHDTKSPTEQSQSSPVHQVLVVDDSLSARRKIVGILKQFGFEITQAGDGMEGLDKFRSGNFPVVFTDVEMPRMDGLELLSEIKSGPQGEATHVFVVSSRSEPEYKDRARELGAAGYLVKPATDAGVMELLTTFAIATSAETRNS